MALEGRAAIVTGSSRGIGRAVALRLAREGASLVLNARQDEAGVRAVVTQVQQMGGQAVQAMGDVSQAETAKQLAEAAYHHFGRVDILVNNAGINRDNLIVRLSETDWDQVLDVDLKGAFLCTRAVLRYMLKQRWGRIINMSSAVGLMGNAGQANYASAKAGLLGLTRSIAREVASRGITVNAVAPGFIDTEMTQALSPQRRDSLLQQIPVGQLGAPEDVAHAVAFLASPEAAYITGQVLPVDGGLVMG
ncbi:MAG: 3-oxoacyl-[acyl-carrier-protein] reductase [Chloroflexi bacterium]|nr:3-oxoacyl-[acyl-carrier-protein] reductase [Chloroflexota bacterium]